mmetsp:Transcript_6808/g.10765  ORF Transcript_6808/g.10765 Transcript_6808/m.10765 type:complete len:542 (+) Transcript_6808:163-1788(+)
MMTLLFVLLGLGFLVSTKASKAGVIQKNLAHPLEEIKNVQRNVNVILKKRKKTKRLEKKKSLTEDTMMQGLRKMEYAVRGDVVIAANDIEDDLKSGKHNHSFDRMLYTNIGNPHSVGQKPLTWPRQVLALADLPNEMGIDHPAASHLFPPDAIRRAREVKEALNGVGTGAYSHSQGPQKFRQDIADFLLKRDGVPAVFKDIFMTNGASAGINMILSCLIADSTCGVMIPMPQYPIYTATLDYFGGQHVGYYLDEENNWDLNVDELERSLADAKQRGINVRGFVLINPGNPTGQVLSEKTVQDVVQFCARNNLVLLADEVYQDNIYDENCAFTSCKKAAHHLGLIDRDEIELVSFHSTSKGLMGECGRRGGYMELVGFDPNVQRHIYKLASLNLCSTVSGQIMTSLMVKGPQPGDESYESHEAEKASILESLKRRAKLVGTELNAIPGFSCQPAQGSMYCFPRVTMPPGAFRTAEELGTTPDTLYATSLLKSTGICVVPASGFGKIKGRYGFRTTFLPPEEEMERCTKMIKEHHEKFCNKYK